MKISAALPILIIPLALASLMLSACVGAPVAQQGGIQAVDHGEVRVTRRRDHDDLLSAGLGLAGLAGAPAPFVDPAHPTAAELRRRAIQNSWKGIADLGPLGGYGTVYGAVPDIPGREYQAFARLPGAKAPHRVLLQLPYNFDQLKRCLVVTASSGSRGIYGAIALAGAWGLPHGCAVAYTDKGTGAGYFDYADDTGVALDGRRARRGDAPLEFEPPSEPEASGIAVKQMNSGDNPEADWGRHVVQAAQFGLAMLDRAFPDEAPFTPQNTRIIATGLSNGGGAVLQAAGLDHQGMFAGMVALEPNVYVTERGRPLFDFATEAAIWLPCALISNTFARTPFARGPDHLPPPSWSVRCSSLRAQGKLRGDNVTEQAENAYAYLRERGWTDEALATAASTTTFDLWRVIGAGYASSYLRRDVANMPCGFHYAATGDSSSPGVATAATRAAWWSDGSGIPPGNGIDLVGGKTRSADPDLRALECLRGFWTGDDPHSRMLQGAVAETAARLPRPEMPLWILHGAADGLLPTAFTSEPYVALLRRAGRQPIYWKVPHAQHFDAFLSLPGFGDHYVPLLPFGYAALDRLWAHLYEGASWPVDAPLPDTRPRGPGPLQPTTLGMVPRSP
ncbi:MAG: 3-hydroxybutyrate oligomer hydrolase family protein [Rhodanobacter sp.]